MKYLLLSLTTLLLIPDVSHAHFLWLALQTDTQDTKVHVYFGEEAGPDDPDLLEKVAAAQVWAVGGRGEPELLTLTIGSESLEGTVTRPGSPLILQHSYGVISRGGEDFLLKYYGKVYPSPLSGTWNAVNDKTRLPLEITPSLEAGKVVLQVTWQGEPLADSTVTVVGPGIDAELEGNTDSKGNFSCKLPAQGTYSIRAKHSESTAGIHAEQAYQSIRHYSTLTLNHQPPQVAPQTHDLPPIPAGVTSFGGAVAGDTLYVFGGNYGDAHNYSEAGQSGDLWTLSLRQPSEWVKLSVGPKLQGLAMAAHDGRVYRVGGFTAMNKVDEAEHLVSQVDFARLAQDGRTWEMLTPLPAGRSSHDIAVVGDTLYVVGGWNMTEDGTTATWHNSALAMDLTAEHGEWREIAEPPFMRRALATAAWNGKLAVIGGMNKDGGPTREVAVYDPQDNSWTTGPTLQGGTMDGFGCAAFAVDNRLIVTTISGSIQQLRPEQHAWDYLGQLSHDRFFHRLLPIDRNRLIIVGGADMGEGKTRELEILQFNSDAVTRR